MQCPSKREALENLIVATIVARPPRRGSIARNLLGRWAGSGLPPLTNIDVDQPLDARQVQSVEQYGIEATRRLAPQIRQKKAGSELDPAALGGGDAGTRSAEGAAAAQAYFDEHQRRAVTRDEIDLAAAAAIVTLDDGETARHQEFGGKGLGSSARIHPTLIEAPGRASRVHRGSPSSCPGAQKCRRASTKDGRLRRPARHDPEAPARRTSAPVPGRPGRGRTAAPVAGYRTVSAARPPTPDCRAPRATGSRHSGHPRDLSTSAATSRRRSDSPHRPDPAAETTWRARRLRRRSPAAPRREGASRVRVGAVPTIPGWGRNDIRSEELVLRFAIRR